MTATSRTQDAYERLRADILDSVHAPREKLRIEALAGTLEVSPGAVREALSRLTAEGLVVAEPQRGFIVAPVSAADLIDLTAVRIEIETRCLRRAMMIGGLAWEGGVIAAWHQLSRTPLNVRRGGRTAINPEWTRLHSVFHDSLIAACDSPWWLRLRGQLYTQAERYRRLELPYGRVERDVDSEHKAIVDAVLARDANAACRLLAAHLQRTVDILLASDAPFDDVPPRRRKPAAARKSRKAA
jgi:DNA-binding GntR family transcriptional regulator